MINNKINKVKVEGNNVFIIQYIDSNGNNHEERKSLNEFLEPIIKPYQDQINVLNELLEEKRKTNGLMNNQVLELSKKVDDLENEIKLLENQVINLFAQIDDKELIDSSDLYKIALEQFLNGQIDKALDTLNNANLEQEEQKALESLLQLSETRLLKARIQRVKNNFYEAKINYRKAINLHTTWKNTLELAQFLDLINDNDDSKIYFEKALQLSINDHQKAICLHNYGKSLLDQSNFNLAESIIKNAVELSTKLFEKDKVKYYELFSLTLNNQAVLQSKTNQLELSKGSFQIALSVRENHIIDINLIDKKFISMIFTNLALVEYNLKNFNSSISYSKQALKIRRALYTSNPNEYSMALGNTLNNLANTYYRINDFQNAENCYRESLKIRKELANQSPNIFLEDVAETLANMGVLSSAKRNHKEALAYYNEALNIKKNMANIAPNKFLPLTAHTLRNIAVIEFDLNNYKTAEKKYKEALSIYRKFESKEKNTFLPDIASTLNNLTNLYSALEDFNEASICFEEALSIYRNLSDRSPKTFLPDLCSLLSNYSLALTRAANFVKSLEVIKEAEQISEQLITIDSYTYKRQFVRTKFVKAYLFIETKEFYKAKELYEITIPILRNYYQDYPEIFKDELASHISMCIVVSSKLNQTKELENLLKEYILIGGKLPEA